MKMMLILFKNKLSMNTNFTKINSKYLGFILIFISSILFLTGEIVNNRFWLADFEVYYKAAQRINCQYYGDLELQFGSVVLVFFVLD